MGKTVQRTLLQRAEQIFDIINYEENSFPKSRLKNAKINPDTAGKWLDLIVFIQSQTRIRLIKTNRNTMVQKLEGKFSIMSRDAFLDESLPIETRLKCLNDYAKSIITVQLLLKDI